MSTDPAVPSRSAAARRVAPPAPRVAFDGVAVPDVDASAVVVVDVASAVASKVEGGCVVALASGEVVGIAGPSDRSRVSSGDADLDARLDAALAAMADPVWEWRGLVFAACEDAAGRATLTRGTVSGPLAWFDRSRGRVGVGAAGGPVFAVPGDVPVDADGSVAWVSADGSALVLDGREFPRVDADAARLEAITAILCR